MVAPVVSVKDLRKWFPVRSGLLGSILGPRMRHVRAVDGVTFQILPGESVALVGESGSGKTTTAKTLLRLLEPTGGSIVFEGKDLTHLRGRELKAMRRRVQAIYQDPYEALNPRQSVYQIVVEPLIAHGLARSESERHARVIQVLEETGLKPASDFLDRYPHELSGGQRQRVAIAAALVLRPSLIVADEPVSMLDVSRRIDIIQLLARLRDSHGLSYLIITHDLSIARYLCDRVLIMYLGRIVEDGPVESVLERPAHPYARALLSAVPDPSPATGRQRIVLQGETPNPIAIPRGCRFHPRCPWCQDICGTEDPPLVTLAGGHQARCHLAVELWQQELPPSAVRATPSERPSWATTPSTGSADEP